MSDKLDASDVNVCLHTALRKFCDSSITSAAYNLIHLICEANLKPKHCAWHLLGELVAEQMNAGREPLVSIRSAISNLDDQFFERVTKPRREQGKQGDPKSSRLWLHTLQCTLKCFSDGDLQSFVSLLEES